MDDQRGRRLKLDCSPGLIYKVQPRELPPPPLQYRQGDVLLIEAARPGGTRTPERPTDGRWILALGEATGHAHAISANGSAEVYHLGGSRYLDTWKPVELVHEEHGTITVAPGTYRVRIQREYVASEPSTPSRTRAWAVGSVRPVRD